MNEWLKNAKMSCFIKKLNIYLRKNLRSSTEETIIMAICSVIFVVNQKKDSALIYANKSVIICEKNHRKSAEKKGKIMLK